VYGGGYSHLLNLSDAGGSHGTAHFTHGPTVGATVGVQLSRHVAERRKKKNMKIRI
jgi:hypothetical protein